MTKEQIKYALMMCNHTTPQCRKCPYFRKVQYCRTTLINDTLKLITRLETDKKVTYNDVCRILR